jgi:Zn-finger nucleic acid-binding protein
MMRDDFAACPHCATGLDRSGQRLVCGTCRGVLVGEDELKRLIAEVAGESPTVPAEIEDLALEPPRAYEPARGCPVCGAAMARHSLHHALVDRCAAHGVWFDGGELEAVLEEVSLAHARPRAFKARRAAVIASAVSVGVAIIATVLRFLSSNP